MEYKKYNKVMVLLSEENRNFADKTEQDIYGNLRIETGNNKGAISLSVQNLKFFERNRYIYKLILFGEKRERTIHSVIGSLILNRFGTGENYFRFDPNNIDGKGNKLSDYSVAIVAAVSMRDNKEALHPVLKGKLTFVGGNVVAANAQEINTRNEFENKKEKIKKVKQSEEIERITYNNFYNKYLKEVCEKMVKVAELYDDILPFSEDKVGACWKRIENIKSFPLVSPGGMWAVAKYRHYIFGEDSKLYYLGVPGRFLKEEQPEDGMSGFALWQPIIGAESLEATKSECSLEDKMTAYGYWITAIDKKTGDIIDPI